MILKAWLKDPELEYAPKKKLAVDHHSDLWPALPNAGLVWFGKMYIHSNIVRTASLAPGYRPGIDFKAKDGC